jgi:arylsulfatase A-like enzyme
MQRRTFLKAAATGVLSATACASLPRRAAKSAQPNFVVVFTDDQGYGDLGCFGATRFKTPNIDRMAAEGVRFTDFHSSSPVCTPSRASLMTGCYAQRVSLPRVIGPNAPIGLNPDEITVAEILKSRGYATACVDKWHLGDHAPFLPTSHGFDSYLGIPYSNDMKPACLLRNEERIEDSVDQDTLVDRYTEEALRFIRAHKDGPFFLYLAHNMPHVPLHAAERFRGHSQGGLYGDVIESIDWSVGQVLNALRENGLDRNTLVIFTSDNGPWLSQGENSGFAAPLRAGKGTTYEGGMRQPCVMRWPGTIPAGSVCREFATTMDILPTFAHLAGGEPPKDRIIDGHDILPLITGQPGAKTPYEAFYYYFQDNLQAVRSGNWKLRFAGTLRYEDIYQHYDQPDAPIPDALYNLDADIGEQRNLIRDHPDIVARLRAYADKARADLGDGKNPGPNVRPPGRTK